jgi:cytochrome P450
MTSTIATRPDAGALFVDPSACSHMVGWHQEASRLRECSPVLRVEADGFAPFFALTRHSLVLAVSRDNERWLNTPWSVLGTEADRDRAMASGALIPRSLVQLDGAKHRQHRNVTSDWFKPAAVARRQARIDDIADAFIEQMRERDGQCDFARDVAQPFTLRVIMDIYGVPESDEPLMLELTQGIFGAADPEFIGGAGSPEERVFGSVMRFILYFNGVTEDRRSTPRDDLATVIANGTVAGCPMGDEERLWYYSYPAANRDPEVFEDPQRFDVCRPSAERHLGFGMGSHFCLGARFARREIRTLLSRLLPRLASIEPAAPPQWSQSNFVSGVKHLPVTYRFKG